MLNFSIANCGWHLWPGGLSIKFPTDRQCSHVSWNFMGAPFSDITLYTPTPYLNGTHEDLEDVGLKNFISDLYVQKMKGYKPPKTTRIAIQTAYHGIWNRTWKIGSIVSIAPFYDHEEYALLDKKGKYKYILDIIQVATLQLSEEYHWDKTVFEKAYKEIIESDFEFKITYRPKKSKDKKKIGQVIIEKTEDTTTLNLLFTIGTDTKTVKLFENKNWYWYDIAYKMAKNSKWLDNNSFGVHLKNNERYGYYSLVDDIIIGKLDFKENEFIL